MAIPPRPHYTVLGLQSDATPAQIKKAYRSLSKKYHPDAGGDREQWDRISKAYEVLSDPARRAKYDATGDDTQSPDPEAQERAQVLSIVRSIISGVLQASQDDPAHIDFRARILRDMANKRRSMEMDKVLTQQKIARVQRFIGRFKTDGEADPVNDVIRQGLRELEQQIENVDRAIELHEKVTQVFLGYQYETDPPPGEGQAPDNGSVRPGRGYRYLTGGMIGNGS